MLTWACEGTWQTSAAFWVPLKGSSLPLFFLLLHTDTHTNTHALKAWLAWLAMGRNRLWLLIAAWRWICVCECVSEHRMGTEGSVQKLLILSSREAMSLNQGQFRTVSPIRNLLSPQHTHTQTVFTLNNNPITKSDGRHIKLKCLLKREMNPSFWMMTLFYSDSMKDLHHTVNGSRQQSHPVTGWVQVTQTN